MKKIDLAGGEGAKFTQGFANTIQQIADQLEADGADPDLVQAISKLANTGHDFDDLQGDISSSCAKDQKTCLIPYVAGGKYSRATGISDQQLTLHSLIQSQLQTVQTQLKKQETPRNAEGVVEGAGLTVSNSAALTHQSANTICNQGGKGCVRVIPPSES